MKAFSWLSAHVRWLLSCCTESQSLLDCLSDICWVEVLIDLILHVVTESLPCQSLLLLSVPESNFLAPKVALFIIIETIWVLGIWEGLIRSLPFLVQRHVKLGKGFFPVCLVEMQLLSIEGCFQLPSWRILLCFRIGIFDWWIMLDWPFWRRLHF